MSAVLVTLVMFRVRVSHMVAYVMWTNAKFEMENVKFPYKCIHL